MAVSYHLAKSATSAPNINSIDAPSGVIIYLQKGWLQPVINSVVTDARHTVSKEGSLSVSACFSIDA